MASRVPRSPSGVTPEGGPMHAGLELETRGWLTASRWRLAPGAAPTGSGMPGGGTAMSRGACGERA